MALSIYFTKEVERFIFLPQDMLSTMPCGHLFLSPIFSTKIFIYKNNPAPPPYSNGGPLIVLGLCTYNKS